MPHERPKDRPHAERGNEEAASQDVPLAPGSSNRGPDASPQINDVERAERHEEFIDESIQLWQNAKRQRDRDKLDLLLSRKTKKATPKEQRPPNNRRAA